MREKERKSERGGTERERMRLSLREREIKGERVERKKVFKFGEKVEIV